MQWNGERGRTFMFQAATRPYEPLRFESKAKAGFRQILVQAVQAVPETKEMPYEVNQATWLPKSDTNMNHHESTFAQVCPRLQHGIDVQMM